MTKEQRLPKRLKIKPFCSIDGVREGKRLRSGLYQLGKNLSESERDLLIGPQFQHCVEILPDAPDPEPLATDAELPQPTPAFKHIEEKRAQAEADRVQRYTLRSLPRDK